MHHQTTSIKSLFKNNSGPDTNRSLELEKQSKQVRIAVFRNWRYDALENFWDQISIEHVKARRLDLVSTRDMQISRFFGRF